MDFLKKKASKIWRTTPQKIQGIWAILRTRLLSFAMVLSIGFLLLVSLVVNAVLSAGSNYFSHALSISTTWLGVVNFLLSIAMITLLFALIFKILPDRKVEWSDVWPGALVSSVLFAIGKYLIGLYIGKSAVASTFGASASVVVVMVWAYYSSSILLFGAEWVKVTAFSRKKREEIYQPSKIHPIFRPLTTHRSSAT